MKKALFLATLFSALACTVSGADLIVQEFAPSPAYNTISAAITAATDGDRIFIVNRAGNLPWVETVTVTKSLTFLPYQDDTFFIVQGQWNIAPTTPKIIDIIGMDDVNGSIVANTSPTGARTVLHILASQLINGNIGINQSNYDLTVSGCNLLLGNGAGTIEYQHGVIIGNSLVSPIIVFSETSASGDTNFIIGNKITITNNGPGIYIQSTKMNCDIRNNYISINNTASANIGHGIYLSSSFSNGVLNKVYNNTINLLAYCVNGYVSYGMKVDMPNVDIMNNVVNLNSCGQTMYGISSSYASNSCAFNFISSNFLNSTSGQFAINQNNTIGAMSIFGTGASSVGVNGGNPAHIFYDLDLTRNDAGCLGGSFSLDNYYPLFTTATQTYLTPSFKFYIQTGNTMSVKGASYDR